MDSERECQAQVHSRRVPFNRGVHKRRNLGKVHDFIDSLADLLIAETEQRSSEIKVFTACKVGIEAGAQLNQRTDSSFHKHIAFVWFHDASDQLQKRAFATAIATDNPDRFSWCDIKAQIAQGV